MWELYKCIRLVVVPLAILSALSVATAQVDQDFGIPDSLYALPPQFQPDGCSGEVLVRMPVYLMTDYAWNMMELPFEWSGDAIVVEVDRGTLCQDTSIFCGTMTLDNEARTCLIQVVDVWGEISPGAGILVYVTFRMPAGEPIQVDFFEENIIMGAWAGWNWTPKICNLDTTFATPGTSTLAMWTGAASSTLTMLSI